MEQIDNRCDFCDTICTSALQLCEHVVGRKHQMRVERSCSYRFVPDMFKLQYFFDTYMKEAPLVGLEFIEEIKKGRSYQYKCLLCGFHGDRKASFLHITGPGHMNMYIMEHHPGLYVNATMYPQKEDYLEALQMAAAKVCSVFGRKKIKETDPTIPKKIEKIEVVHDQKGDLQANHDQKGDLQVNLESKEDQGGFSGNGDFLDYLQKFVIRDDEDARILQQITQNCTQALVRYWRDQTPVNQAAGAQGDATQLFFNSIKNMEESEVADTLHKIAATNPAFRGIAVPNVIKYLRETGRLKVA